MKKSLITGISGQDGSYLAELLLAKGYEVHGIIRRSSSPNTGRINHILDRLHLHSGDMTDSGSLNNIVQKVRPDEVYNLAAQSHVRTSFENPEYTANTDGLGTLRLIEAVRACSTSIKFYQASTSELYGTTPGPQDENTPFRPCSPYGIAKQFAHDIVKNYRESYNMFACCGILFNHESERRGDEFVTKKIVKALVHILEGSEQTLYLGNLEAKRDWGYAPDYVEGMYRMMQHDSPDDFVLATGETHTIKDFLDATAEHLNIYWEKYVEIDPKLYRPTEVDYLLGDYGKAKRVLDWEPKVRFKELVRIMCDAELGTYD